VILAGDIGGTKTNLALFNGVGKEPTHLATYRSHEHGGLEEMVQTFLREHPAKVEGACFGVAGPVLDGRCVDTTNLAWLTVRMALPGIGRRPTPGLASDGGGLTHSLAVGQIEV
jgi:glucokinase